MARYIDAEKLKLLFWNAILDFIPKHEIVMMIDYAPTADVEEVKHGVIQKMYRGGNPLWDEETVCSLCLHTVWDHFNYCPNCGAKMDGKEQRNGQD